MTRNIRYQNEYKSIFTDATLSEKTKQWITSVSYNYINIELFYESDLINSIKHIVTSEAYWFKLYMQPMLSNCYNFFLFTNVKGGYGKIEGMTVHGRKVSRVRWPFLVPIGTKGSKSLSCVDWVLHLLHPQSGTECPDYIRNQCSSLSPFQKWKCFAICCLSRIICTYISLELSSSFSVASKTIGGK